MIIVEGLKENEISTRLERLRELSSSADGLYFAVGVCFVEGDVDILKAMRIADERMYESKREYYQKNPNQKYR